MWPFTRTPPLTRQQRLERSKREISELLTAAIMSRRVYWAFDMVDQLTKDHNNPEMTAEGKAAFIELLEQFVDHCELDGWTKNLAYKKAKQFVGLMKPAP